MGKGDLLRQGEETLFFQEPKAKILLRFRGQRRPETPTAKQPEVYLPVTGDPNEETERWGDKQKFDFWCQLNMKLRN